MLSKYIRDHGLIYSLMGLLVASLAGCGGGASETVDIVAKPAESEPSGTGGTSTDNGDSSSNSSSAPAAEGYGTLTGKVVIDGTFEQLKPLYEQGDPTVKDGQVCVAEDLPDQSIVVNAGGLANVFIYLSKKPAKAKELDIAQEMPVKFDQKQCLFIPHAMSVAVGQPLVLLNSDPIAHNTNIKPIRGSGFNQLLAPQTTADAGPKFVYELPEPVPATISCDIHPWMRAYHMPLDHPYSAVTSSDGTFEIKDLPAGEHKLKVWHEKGGFLERNFKVTVEPDKASPVEIKVKPADLATYIGPASKHVVISLAR